MLKRRTFLNSALVTAAVTALPKPAFAKVSTGFKIYDTHAHLFTSDLKNYPYKPDVAPMQKIRTTQDPVTPEHLFKLWDDNGIEMGCGVQYNTTYATDNSYLLDSAAKYPSRIMPVVILPPANPTTPATIARMAKQNGIVGVRFNSQPDAQGNLSFLADATRGVWETANELGLTIVLILLRSDNLKALPLAMGRVSEFAVRYPNVTIVLDHFAFPPGPVFSPTFSFSPEHLALAQHKNIYMKYTTYLIEQLHGGNVEPRDFLRYAVDVYGADHMMWGSDVGNSAGSFADHVNVALESATLLSPVERQALFYDTAKKLFASGGRGRAGG